MADKLFTYVIILVMLSLLFAAIGADTAAGAVLSAFGITSGGINWYSSTFYTIVAIGLLTAGAISIWVGFTSKTSAESAILINIGYIAAMLTFIADFVGIIQYGFAQGTFAGWIALMILSPLYAGFIITVVQHWRGID